MTHPRQLDLQAIIQQGAVLIVNGSKGAVGEENANLVCAMLSVLIQKTLHQQQRRNPVERPGASLIIDEAHNIFTPSFATLLSEGRSGGIEVTTAFQYTGQITDERVKSGIKSLLQNISIFRLREFEDARAAAALAMEVFSDNIKGEVEDQRRLRLDPMDILNSPDYRAANLWLSDGTPQPAFTAHTEPLDETPKTISIREHHEQAQRHRGYHPYDVGHYVQPPLVRSSSTPVIARNRTIHIDLTGWAGCPPHESIRRVMMILYPEQGQPLGLAAESEDHTARHYCVQLTDDQHAISWLPAGRYRLAIHVHADGEPHQRVWSQTQAPDGEAIPLSITLADESRDSHCANPGSA
jgi:hypothetical protein